MSRRTRITRKAATAAMKLQEPFTPGGHDMDASNDNGNGLPDDTALSKLALRPREAAEKLSISERKLWSLTQKGEIRHKKSGGVVLYAVEWLQDWLDRRTEGGVSDD